ncbi:MAG: hypothetical protein RMJ84_08375 [Sandaracinaceae bacterium]|nr:hypothetical protein [Sandaracinaceae bacterium]
MWINLRSWIEGGSYCTLAITPDIRFITLRLSEGMWTIRSRRGDASLVVDVESAPALPCAPSGGAACRQDCDCRPNERCLSTWGFAGPVLECIEPCEEDLDCSERGEVCLQTSSDWFDHVCTGTGKNCTHPGRPCPESYECDGERCKPTFVLNSSTRRECRCNADCPRGLRCVRAGARGRCEAICPTGGRFCPPQHACAQASEDRSGLALSDSVCVWLGE